MMDVKTYNLILRALFKFVYGIKPPREDDKCFIPDANCVKIIYEGTASESNPMRQLLVRLWWHEAEMTWVHDDRHTLPGESLAELALLGKEYRSSYSSFQYVDDLEDYMEKEDDTEVLEDDGKA